MPPLPGHFHFHFPSISIYEGTNGLKFTVAFHVVSCTITASLGQTA